MAELTHGTITISLPDDLMPQDPAGKLDPRDISRVPKAPRGLGTVCSDAADAMEKAADQFIPPQDVTPDSLRTAGNKAERLDQVIQDAEVVLSILKQAGLLAKAEAYEQVRKVNDQVRTQGKHNQTILTIFERLVDFFSRLRKRKGYTPPSSSAPPTVIV